MRISFSLVLLYRFGLIIATEKYYFGNQLLFEVDLIIIICCLLLIINYLVPLTYIILNISILYFDINHSTSTLGTSVASLTIFSLLGNSMVYNNINPRKGFIFQIQNYICKLFRNIINIRVFHLHAYYAYAICSFLAFTFHIFDDSWLKGETLGKMLTSTYLCRFHTPFLYFQNIFPHTFYITSVMGVIGHTLFQILLPFALFNRFTKFYVIVWGWIFIINCTIFFQLSYLPLIEIILWVSLFHFRSGIGIKINKDIFRKILLRGKALSLFFIIIYASYFFFYYNIPKIGNLNSLISRAELFIPKPPYYFYKLFGLDTPNVFNCDDLKMSNHWLVTTRSYSNDHSNSTLVPITHFNGEKGWYQQFDFLYFGNSVIYRRHLINQDPFIHRDNCSYCKNLIHKRILFDYRLNDFNKIVYYRCYFFDKSNPNLSLFELKYFITPEQIINQLN